MHCLGGEKFTDREIKRFQTRFENNYDIKTDERYNKWMKLNYPEEYKEFFSKSGKQLIIYICD